MKSKANICPACGWTLSALVAPAYGCSACVRARKGKQARPTARHKDRTKYDRKDSRRQDCRDILLDRKDD